MNLVENALRIALDAHAGQTDKAGAPYVLHPIRVMLKMDSAELQAAALLHDVIEDSDGRWTENDLRQAGIPDEVIEIVKALTNPPDGVYAEFIAGISYNPDAIRVKLADIEDNLDVRRIEELTDKDLARIRKYHQAWHRLRAALDRHGRAPGYVSDDERREEPRRLKPQPVADDDPIFRRGYVVPLPGSGVMPRRAGKPERTEGDGS